MQFANLVVKAVFVRISSEKLNLLLQKFEIIEIFAERASVKVIIFKTPIFCAETILSKVIFPNKNFRAAEL